MNTDIPAKEGFVSYRGYQVWYRVVGDREAPGKFPLLCLHGGPGATHDYLEPLEAMVATGGSTNKLRDKFGAPCSRQLW